jgi:hypothetical protein
MKTVASSTLTALAALSLMGLTVGAQAQDSEKPKGGTPCACATLLAVAFGSTT